MEARIEAQIGVRPADSALPTAGHERAAYDEVDGWTTFIPRPWLEGGTGPAFGPITFQRETADPADPGPTPDEERARRADAAESDRSISDVLAVWRAAERELAALADGDPEIGRVHAELVGLRALHHRLFDERIVPENEHERGLRLRMCSSSFTAPSRGVMP